MDRWKYALSSADEAPSTAPILLQGSIGQNLKKAKKLGYHAIEIHLREDDDVDYQEVLQTMQETGVKVSSIVTGRLNTEGKCSLIDDAPYIVETTVNHMKQYIDMAAVLKTDIVIGWVKGNVPEGGKREKYLKRLAKNLRVLAEYAMEKNVKINIEVINRYEVNVFTTSKELVDFLNEYQIPNCYVHLDTFHMYIDEANPVEAIQIAKGKIGYFHLADNSRRYPGSGQIDFKKILKALDEAGYDGYLAVECFPYPNGEIAAQKALAYLKNLL